MFCPKCGEEMEQSSGIWICGRGEMHLSALLSRAFTDVYLLKTRPPENQPVNFKVDGPWYCPGCGIPAEAQNGSVTCSQCGQSLNEFLWPLVELHPHKAKAEN